MAEDTLHKIRRKKKSSLGENSGNLCHANWYGPTIQNELQIIKKMQTMPKKNWQPDEFIEAEIPMANKSKESINKQWNAQPL